MANRIKMHVVNITQVKNSISHFFQGKISWGIGGLEGRYYQGPVTDQSAVPVKGWMPST